MKGLVGLGVVGFLGCLGVWWLSVEAMSDQGFSIAMAHGHPADDGIQLHMVVDMGMTRREGPRQDKDGNILWDEWVEKHFELHEASGQRVEMHRLGQSMLIPANKVPGAQEFYLKAALRPGVNYTFDYLPKRAEPNRYRYTFSAPADTTPMKRHTFELVEQ